MLNLHSSETKPSPTEERVLFVSSTFPYDIERSNYGVFQRMRMLLEAAKEEFPAIDAIFFVDPNRIDLQGSEKWEQLIEKHWNLRLKIQLVSADTYKESWASRYFLPILSLSRHPNFKQILSWRHHAALRKAIQANTTLILAHRLSAGLLSTSLGTPTPPVVMDLDDVEHIKFLRDLSRPPHWLSKYLEYLHFPQLMLSELRCARHCGATLVCSSKDRQYLRRLTMRQTVEEVPNGVELKPNISPKDRIATINLVPTLLFIGAYSYEPNVQAAETLINEVFPKIRAILPNAQLVLVGNRIERLPSHGSEQVGVQFLGFVESLDLLFKNAHIMCCPIHSGGGTRIKIIEAASQGLPVVSTTIGAEGLDFEDGLEIVLADTSESLAAACVQLLTDPAKRQSIGAAAWSKAKIYDRRNSIESLRRIYRKTASS